MFHIEVAESTLSARFSARLELVDRLWVEVKSWLILNHLEPMLFSVNLVLREAVNNAIKHGCALDHTQTVKCSLRLLPDSVEIDVQDSGPGFNWQQKMDFLANHEPDVMACSGRGIMIMQLYAQEVEFSSAGNGLRLKIPRPCSCETQSLPLRTLTPLKEGEFNGQTESDGGG